MKWERLTWEVAEGLSVAALRDREEVGMVVAVSDCTEKASIGEARRMISCFGAFKKWREGEGEGEGW